MAGQRRICCRIFIRTEVLLLLLLLLPAAEISLVLVQLSAFPSKKNGLMLLPFRDAAVLC